MARYDVFLLQGTRVLDVQTDLIDQLQSRAVVPLLPVSETPPSIRRLHPVFELDGEKLVMATQLIGAVPNTLFDEPIGNLSAHNDEIVAALDMLFHGF